MSKKIICLLLLGVSLTLTGCNTAISVARTEPLSLEEVAGNRMAKMTADQKEGAIYKFISDRIIVDPANLMSIGSKDLSNINSLFSDVNQKLKGVDKECLSDEYANYLLMEFAKTPYEWQQTKVTPVGFDPAARLYFVDVTYNTTNTYKTAIPDSKIPNGATYEDTFKKKRYDDYVNYLNAKVRNDNKRINELRDKFVQTWGDVQTIREEQQGVSLLTRTKQKNQESGGLGKLTYSGLVADSKLSVNASMTVRYVLQYKYNLGQETDLTVNALYVKDYKLGNPDNILASYDSSNLEGIEVLKPFVDKVILSYNKAVEESSNNALYSLYANYGSIDKYYDDIYKYAYTSIGNYTYKILEKKGTNLVVQVDRVNQIRAKGANMSLPTYDETIIMNMVLTNDDSIQIKSVYPIKSELVGEPLSVIKNVTGISDLIQYSGVSFTESNKAKVEDVLKKFSKVVFSGTVDSAEFAEVTDVGISEMTLQKMVDTITTMNANKKATYIISWDTKTNVYVSLRIREVFQTSGGNYDTEAIVDFVQRSGEWKVVNYTRTLNIKTSGGSVDSDSAFCIDSK